MKSNIVSIFRSNNSSSYTYLIELINFKLDQTIRKNMWKKLKYFKLLWILMLKKISKALIYTLIVFVLCSPSITLYNIANAQGSNATSQASDGTSQIAAKTGTISPSPSPPISESLSPSLPTEEQLEFAKEIVNETYRYPQEFIRETAPPTEAISLPPNDPTLIQVSPPQSSNTNSTMNNLSLQDKSNETSQLIQQPSATPSFQLYKDSIVNALSTSTVNEPSVSNNGPLVSYTVNWATTRSVNDGDSWTHLNPYADFPSSPGLGFCCDQNTIYDEENGIFIWIRQGVPDSNGQNVDRLSISTNGINWIHFDFTSQMFGAPANTWLDYNQLSTSNKYLYITNNIFDGQENYVMTVLARVSLEQLKQGSDITYEYISETEEFNFAPVQGETDTMYAALHHSNTQMKIYKWPDASSTVDLFQRNIPVWQYGFGGNMDCSTPNGIDACDRSDSRILGGSVADGNVTFLWNARQDNTFSYPYVNVVTFNEAGMTYLDNNPIWNPNFAFMYGDMAPNQNGDIGIITMYGGGPFYPSIALGAKLKNNMQYDLLSVSQGNAANSAMGDYLTVAPDSGEGPTFRAGGYILNGCGSNNCVESHYYSFGYE